MRNIILLSFSLILSVTSMVVPQTSGKVELIITTPMGETQTIDQTQMIVATFNQPMVPLREVPVNEDSGPLLIRPTVSGKYRWQGTRTLSFIPADRLPYSTEYTVKIPAGTKSISAKVMDRDFIWKFETPRPRVISHSPSNQQKNVELDHAILIRFNQPVDPQTVSKWISIEEHIGNNIAYIPFTASQADDKKEVIENTILLKSTNGWQKEGVYVVRCKAGIVGTEGLLPMTSDYSFTFKTFREFKFEGIRNVDGFYPTQALRLHFSNPVPRKEVLSHFLCIPPVHIEQEESDEYYPTNEIHISLQLEPEKNYIGVLTPGIKDRFGNILKDTVKFSFRTGSFLPSVKMTTVWALEAYEAHRYPVTFTNVDSVMLSLGRIDPEKIIPVMRRLDYSAAQELIWHEAILDWGDARSEDTSNFTITSLWYPSIPRNKPTECDINLDKVLGKSKLGIVLVQVDNLFRDPNKRRYLKALIQVTNLGVTAKFSPENNLIWVTQLKDAEPVEGAKVEIRNDSNVVIWKGETDSHGCAKSPGWGKLGFEGKRISDEEEEYWYDSGQPRQWVIVKYKGDVAVTNSEWNEGLQPWTFGVPIEWRPQFEPIEGEIFSDRGLYRAGEQVDIKGILRVRRDDELRIPKLMPLRLTIRNSRNEEIFKTTPVLSEFGSFATSLMLKPSAPLGYYSMRLEVQMKSKGKERWVSVASDDFRVEAFRPAEFQVIAQTAKKFCIIGDTVSGIFSAKYLFGAPLQNAPVTWRASVSPSYWQPEGFEDYFFGTTGWLSKYRRSQYQVLSTKDTVLDKFGNLGVSTDLNVGEIRGTAMLTFEAEVQSPSRQAIAGRASVVVHGGEYYIGIAPASTFVKSDTIFSYKIITVTPEGKPVSGQTLNGKIFKRIWRSVRKAETGGRYYWQSETEDIPVDSLILESDGKAVVQTYTPKEPGFYYIHFQGKDQRGNTITSEAYFYVSGSSYVPWERSNDDRIELITNKKNYKTGETASIIVKSPYEKAIALVSLERNGILRHFVTTLVGSAPQIDLPISRDCLPNVFVSVILLQGRVARPAESREADVGRPSFKIGYTTLLVSPLEKKLAVNVVSTKTEYRPGDSVEVQISTKDFSGRGMSAEVTLSVADLGVLNLINYRLPDIFQRFYRTQSLAVVTTETRLNLVKQRNYGEKGEDEGGGGGDENAQGYDAEGIRKLFKPSAYWNPSILTDRKGNAIVRFKLPDNLTSFEIMAVAHTKESDFGYGENSFRVSKPLLMHPALPRFARVGDSFEGGVLLLNYTDKDRQVKLMTNVKGLLFNGPDSMAFTLKAGEGKEIRHAFRAEKIGTAVLTFKVLSETDRDGLQWKIPIQVPRLKETVALYESSKDPSVEEQTVVPRNIYKELGEINVTLSSTAMVGLEKGIKYLFEYPYGCLEQRLSHALPIIMAKDIVESFNFEELKDKNYRAAAEKVLDEIPAFQRENGGFSYWKNTYDVSPYLSAFAMYSLAQAQRNGYTVEKRVMDKGFQYLRKVLEDEQDIFWYDKTVSFCTDALILYTYALAGKPDYGYMENLYTQRSHMPLFARAYLLKALSAAKGNEMMISNLTRELLNMAKVSSTSAHFEEGESNYWAWIFHSNVRTTALVMQAIVETHLENPIIPKVVRWLIDQQKMCRWRTTQENLYVVDALATYFRKYESEEPDFKAEALLEGGKLVESIFKGRSLKTASGSIALAELIPGVTYKWEFKKEGTGRMYRNLTMNYYPQGETTAKEEGLSVMKIIVDPQKPNTPLGTLTAGSVAKISLTIATTQDRNFVVVDDPIPAGFEIIDRSFETTASSILPSEMKPEEQWRWNPFKHREFYDDRALFFADYLPAGIHTVSYLVRATRYGSFQLPSTRAEGMYEPEVFGQTSSKIFKVE